MDDDFFDIGDYLDVSRADYTVDVAYNDEDGSYLSQVNEYDAILIDSSLPASVCEDVRSFRKETPILVFSNGEGLGEAEAAVAAGADDVIPKPVNPKDVSLKLEARIRRARKLSAPNLLEANGLKVDFSNREVFVFNQQVELTRREYEIFEYLVLRRNTTLSEERILNYVYPNDSTTMSNTVAVHISRLRQKIEKPYKKPLIKTVWGFGYKVEL